MSTLTEPTTLGGWLAREAGAEREVHGRRCSANPEVGCVCGLADAGEDREPPCPLDDGTATDEEWRDAHPDPRTAASFGYELCPCQLPVDPPFAWLHARDMSVSNAEAAAFVREMRGA